MKMKKRKLKKIEEKKETEKNETEKKRLLIIKYKKIIFFIIKNYE